MQLGMIGAGRMGGHMVIRLMKAGHNCVVYARHEESIKDAVDHGAKGTTDLKEFVGMLEKPRAVWLMVPAAAVDKVLDDLIPIKPGDRLIVDGELLESDSLEMDESHLTGESDSVLKDAIDDFSKKSLGRLIERVFFVNQPSGNHIFGRMLRAVNFVEDLQGYLAGFSTDMHGGFLVGCC